MKRSLFKKNFGGLFSAGNHSIFFGMIFLATLFLIYLTPINAAASMHSGSSCDGCYRLENPMNPEYLKAHLRSESPRILLTPELEKQLLEKLRTDVLVRSYYEALRRDASQIMEQPLLNRRVDGMRMLSDSREMVYRLGTLSMVYRIDREEHILERINEELRNVCTFSDWNPSHFLDAGEMAFAVALALDWAGESLPQSTVQLAQKALIEKAIHPSYMGTSDPNRPAVKPLSWGGHPAESNMNWWINAENNWNQVVHGGLMAASIAIAEIEPELAARTLHRALEKMNLILEDYGPDGNYPEGATYWEYGTMYQVLTASFLESAFGSDFGISNYPGFLESADFRMLLVAPGGEFFNYFDSGSNLLNHRGAGDVTVGWFNRGRAVQTLLWFAVHTGNPLYFDRSFFLADPQDVRSRDRFGAPSLIWLSQYEPGIFRPLPLIWRGRGKQPVAIFRGGTNQPENNPEGFYLGAKGGKAMLHHGNMDAGSFVFELDGVRWSVDPGNQGYRELEHQGYHLWGEHQDSDRWLLLTKGSHGHSTLTVNESLHNVSGFAPIVYFSDGSKQEMAEVTFDLTDIFQGQLANASRRFVKENSRTVLIEDQLRLVPQTRLITWQMMTQACVVPVTGGAELHQDGQKLYLEILSPENLQISVVSLDPPPLKWDKHIDRLKRIEIRVPAWIADESGEIDIRIRLTGNPSER